MNIPLRTPIPPLRDGDRLSRDEFERRYEAMPEVKKAELIDGVVYMPMPVSWEFHGSPHMDVCGWLAVYKASTPGTDVGDNATVRLDMRNEPQPDATLIVRPEYGGRVAFDENGYLSGSPDLIVEVSASSVKLDLGKSSTPTGGTASASTSSGGSKTGSSTGSSSATAGPTGSPRTRPTGC